MVRGEGGPTQLYDEFARAGAGTGSAQAGEQTKSEAGEGQLEAGEPVGEGAATAGGDDVDLAESLLFAGSNLQKSDAAGSAAVKEEGAAAVEDGGASAVKDEGAAAVKEEGAPADEESCPKEVCVASAAITPDRPADVSHHLISHKMFLKSFCKSRFPHKFVNLFFISAVVKDKLTNLWGS